MRYLINIPTSSRQSHVYKSSGGYFSRRLYITSTQSPLLHARNSDGFPRRSILCVYRCEVSGVRVRTAAAFSASLLAIISGT